MDQPNPPTTTTDQRTHFWTMVQDQIAAITAQAERYLPGLDEDDSALDEKAVEEIVNVLYQARAAADTAAGAYTRVGRRIRTNGENIAPAPAARQGAVPAGRAAGSGPDGWR